jgi:hypothetical protein
VLDSAGEIRFLQDALGGLAGVSFLDIGAGYGRFGHRVHEYDASARVLCTDGVAMSTFISEFYVDHRQCGPNVSVVPLTAIAATLGSVRCDVAVNIHSFPECPLSAIEWWLALIVDHGIDKLFLVPNDRDDLRSWEPDGERKDFRALLQRFGFELELRRPNYASDDLGLLFPSDHLLFSR